MHSVFIRPDGSVTVAVDGDFEDYFEGTEEEEDDFEATEEEEASDPVSDALDVLDMYFANVVPMAMQLRAMRAYYNSMAWNRAVDTEAK